MTSGTSCCAIIDWFPTVIQTTGVVGSTFGLLVVVVVEFNLYTKESNLVERSQRDEGTCLSGGIKI
jgi:hypothetical protein